MARVHRLVALAWIPNPEGKPQINHRDGNKSHNAIANLEWCTGSENRAHALRTGLAVMPAASTHVRKLSAEQVATIRARLSAGEGVRPLAREFNIAPKTIRDIRSGDTWRAAP